MTGTAGGGAAGGGAAGGGAAGPVGRPDRRPAGSARFDAFAERYARFNELRDRLLPTAGWLASQLPGGGRAVDLGCGDGLHTARLAERYEYVLGVDVSAALLEIARERHGHPAVVYQQRGVMEVTPQRDGRFDAVVSVNALHHVGPLPEVLAQVRRLVAPGGTLAVADIVDPGGWADRQWQVTQAFDGARRFYEAAGGDPDVAADVLRLLLHPRWLDMSTTDIPPTRADFHRQVAAVFPDAVIADGLHPVMAAFRWQAPGSSCVR